jgi:hypothetical protein
MISFTPLNLHPGRGSLIGYVERSGRSGEETNLLPLTETKLWCSSLQALPTTTEQFRISLKMATVVIIKGNGSCKHIHNPLLFFLLSRYLTLV